MIIKNTIRKKRGHVVLGVLFMILLGQPILAQQHVIREEVQHAIRHAETLAQGGKYAEALRLLFDAMYKEQRVYPLSPPPYSPYAAEALTAVERSLLRQDHSPLMQLFRDLGVPLEQKLLYIQELRKFARQEKQHDKEVVLGGKPYRGTLIQLLGNHTLEEGEKIDVLYWIDEMVREQYTSEAQKQRIRENISHLRNIAEQRFQEHQYAEAFVFHEEAIRKTQMIRDDYMELLEESARMLELLFELDKSPLMELFKNQKVPIETKQRLMSEMRRQLSPGTEILLFEGKEYDGPSFKFSVTRKLAGR